MKRASKRSGSARSRTTRNRYSPSEYDRPSSSRYHSEDLGNQQDLQTPTKHRSSSKRPHSPEKTSNSHLENEVQEIRATMLSIQKTLQSLQPPAAQPPTATFTPSAEIDQSTLRIPHLGQPSSPPSSAGNDNIIQSFLPSPRPVITTGIGITAHVAPQLKEKIWRDEYIQFSQLLPQQSSFYSESVTLALCHEAQNNLGLKLTKPKPATLSLQQWEDAFLVYMAIYTERHPVCAAMCTYMRDVKDMARRGANFTYYDEQFRIERAITHCPWDSVHQSLLFQATTPFRPPVTQSKMAKKPFPGRIPTGYCIPFHTPNTVCRTFRCMYKHSCPTCEARHPQYRCNERHQHNERNVQPNQKPDHTGTKPKSKDINPSYSK